MTSTRAFAATALSVAAALASLAAAPAAQAAACTATAGSFIGAASTDDVTLGGIDSSQCVISGVNPAQGPNGNTAGFDAAFGDAWSLLSKGPGSATIGGVTFTLGFSQGSGTWSLTTDQAATFDLVFALHASDHSGAFLFDNEKTFAGVTQNGSWSIQWLNNGGQVPGFSNINFFIRDVALSVPEPATYAMLFAGLVAGGFIAARRRAAR
ncbi:MAG TPA: PEP-CTERM sorting domain-containing protein [Burkholderiaceae bacterium]|nr:PEP-CTERM sorting domain-containing protein [Burkholderiaceae bacterium]